MKPLTVEDVLEGLEKAVEKRGEDFVYPSEWMTGFEGSCQYFLPNGDAACIIGEVFAGHGIKLSDLSDRENITGVSSGFFSRFFADEDAQIIACEAQGAQDAQSTWGKSLTAARKFAKVIR